MTISHLHCHHCLFCGLLLKLFNPNSMFAPTSILLIDRGKKNHILSFPCLLVKPSRTPHQTPDHCLTMGPGFPGKECVSKGQKNKYVLGMVRCLVGWSMVEMAEGGTSREGWRGC